ncbi:MAG TPA: PAS domain S-box protein, partial [Geminicoccaceae bacterium]
MHTRRLVRVAGRLFDATFTPVLAGDGSVARVVGLGHDVTELHACNQALSESEARLRDFVEVTSDWLWETDEEHQFIGLSVRFVEVVGADPARFIGRRRAELRVGDPADGDWAQHELALAERRPFRDFVYGLVDGRGGRRVVVMSSGVPVHGPDGRFRGYRGSGRDITRRVEAEERLRESEARFRSLVTNMRGVIFCRGVAGRGDHGHDGGGAALYGADVDALAGTRDPEGCALIDLWYGCVHPHDQGAYAAAERRRKDRHEPYAIEYRINHPRTGELRWMREVAWTIDERESGQTYFDSYILDITEAKRTEQALRDSRERYQRLIEEAPVAILIYREGRCLYANPRALRILAAGRPEEMVGRRLLDLADGTSRQRLQERLAELLAAGVAGIPSAPQEIRCRRLDGRSVTVEASMAAISEGGEAAVQVVLIDVTARKRAEAGIRHMAHHDALTGLPNRVLLLDRLAHAIGGAARERRPAALMVLDLDGFKEVNDTLGHAAGDVLLREVARRVRGVARQSDTLARLGGDEFAIVQTGLASPRDAAGLAGRIVDAVARPFVIDGQEVRAGVSVGINLFPRDAATAGGLL